MTGKLGNDITVKGNDDGPLTIEFEKSSNKYSIDNTGIIKYVTETESEIQHETHEFSVSSNYASSVSSLISFNADTKYCNIVGRIVDESGTPLKDASVDIYVNEACKYHATTSTDGLYELLDISRNADITMYVSYSEDYSEQEREISKTDLSSNVIEQNFILFKNVTDAKSAIDDDGKEYNIKSPVIGNKSVQGIEYSVYLMNDSFEINEENIVNLSICELNCEKVDNELIFTQSLTIVDETYGESTSSKPIKITIKNLPCSGELCSFMFNGVEVEANEDKYGDWYLYTAELGSFSISIPITIGESVSETLSSTYSDNKFKLNNVRGNVGPSTEIKANMSIPMGVDIESSNSYLDTMIALYFGSYNRNLCEFNTTIKIDITDGETITLNGIQKIYKHQFICGENSCTVKNDEESIMYVDNNHVG